MNQPAAAPAHPPVVGYVEVMSAQSVLGWAWMPASPGVALEIALTLGGDAIATAVANLARDDLATNGIGDGRHAFTLSVPAAAQNRLAELRVAARTPDGTLVPLASPPAAPGLNERMEHLQRGLDVIVGSQRVLHRNLQAALLARAESQTEALPPPGTAPDLALREQVVSLELFLTRLDAQLAALARAPEPPARRPATLAALAISATALVLSVWGLVEAIPK